MELYTEWVTKKYPGCVDYTDESRQITCDRGGPAVGWGVSRAVTISPPTAGRPRSLVVGLDSSV